MERDMKCPKCGYISFDHHDHCPKCKKNISDTRAKLNLPAFMANPISVKIQDNLGVATGAAAVRGSGALAAVLQESARGNLRPEADSADEPLGLTIDIDELTLVPEMREGTPDAGHGARKGIDNLEDEISEIDLAIESLEEDDLEPVKAVKAAPPGPAGGAGAVRKSFEVKSAGKKPSLDFEELDLDLDLEGGKKK